MPAIFAGLELLRGVQHRRQNKHYQYRYSTPSNHRNARRRKTPCPWLKRVTCSALLLEPVLHLYSLLSPVLVPFQVPSHAPFPSPGPSLLQVLSQVRPSLEVRRSIRCHTLIHRSYHCRIPSRRSSNRSQQHAPCPCLARPLRGCWQQHRENASQRRQRCPSERPRWMPRAKRGSKMWNRYRYGTQGGQFMRQSNRSWSVAPNSALQQQTMRQEWLRQQQRLRGEAGAGNGAGGIGATNQPRVQDRQGRVQGDQATRQARQRAQRRVQDCPAVEGAEATP